MQRLAYGAGRSQYGELLRGGANVAVLIHGGFWKAKYGRKLMHPLAHDLHARGWTVWNVEYRRLGNGGGWPQTYHDVEQAVGHLHHLDLPLDAEVVAIGHSAGGHLAALLAPKVTKVVAQAGVLDLHRAAEWDLSDGVVRRFAREDHWTEASPAHRLPLGVPTLLTHGGRDDIVPPRMSEEFATRARAAGDDVTLTLLPDEGHFGHLDPGNPLWQAVIEWIA